MDTKCNIEENICFSKLCCFDILGFAFFTPSCPGILLLYIWNFEYH